MDKPAKIILTKQVIDAKQAEVDFTVTATKSGNENHEVIKTWSLNGEKPRLEFETDYRGSQLANF